MLNQVVLVGRLIKDPELKELENGTKVCNITIAVPRSYKNKEGAYDTDFITCSLWNNIALNTTEYCQKGDMIGIKGHLKMTDSEKEGQSIKELSLHADKITFLASSQKKQEKEKTEVER